MELQFQKGTTADAERFVRFLEEIRAEMPEKEWLYLDPPETVRMMLSDGIMELWLAMDGGRLAAVFSVLYPGLGSDNYGYDLGLTEEELLQVVHMDTSAVHRDYRGLGLQRKMAMTAEAALAGQGNKILLCTVHPENVYSLNNMLRQGYMIQKRIPKYGSERFVLRKNIF